MRFAVGFLAAVVALAPAIAVEPANASAQIKTRVVVLGVEHSGQLVSKAYRPAVFEAFFERVKPDAICVERDPEAFAANDHYEFTYEISEIAVPYAVRNGLGLCPFDWAPSTNDLLLAFGSDINVPPLIRQRGAFLSFPDASATTRTLFWAEDRKAVARWDAFADKPQANAGGEMARRLFLYRTALQAKRIAEAARARQGQTLLVLVGAFHERDIEALLAKDSAIELVQAPTYGAPSDAEAARFDSRHFEAATLVFNLLGQQSSGPVDWAWMHETLNKLDKVQGPSPESRFLRLRLERLTGAKDAASAIKAYKALAGQIPAHAAFTWTGRKDASRLDTYFDPFGNVSVRQRVMIEMARELYSLGRRPDAERIRLDLARDLPPGKRAQLASYWDLLISPKGSMGNSG